MHMFLGLQISVIMPLEATNQWNMLPPESTDQSMKAGNDEVRACVRVRVCGGWLLMR